MAFLVYTDAKIYFSAYNISGYSNEIQLQQMVTLLPADTFDSSSTKKNVPGLKDFKGTAKGFMDYADIGATAGVNLDSIFYGRIGGVGQAFSCAPVGNAEADRAYFSQYVTGAFDPLSGKVGDLLPWSADFNAVGVPMIQGTVAAVGVKSSTGQTSATFNYPGGVLSNQRLYANLHVVSASGTTPTLDVIVQSSVDNTFASPTTRLTFTQATSSVTSEHKSVAGAITDAYFRMKWTIGGTTPSYRIFGVIGIL